MGLTAIFLIVRKFKNFIQIRSLIKTVQNITKIHFMDTLKYYDMAGIAFLSSATSPLELVKTRLQTMPQLIAKGHLRGAYNGAVDCFKKVKNYQGYKGFWKGNAIGLVRMFPNELLNLKIKNFSQTHVKTSFIGNIISGIAGGWGASFILYPLDTIRLILSNRLNCNKKIMSCLKQQTKTHGLKFFYRGFKSSLVGIALFRGAFFGVYDTTKIKSNTQFERWCCAYISSVTATFITYPLDTLRRRKIFTNENCSDWKFFKQICKKQNFKGFYRGWNLAFFQCFTGSLVLYGMDKQSLTNE